MPPKHLFSRVSQYDKYDAYEARAGFYRAGARHLCRLLASRFSPAEEGLIYDFGCGTGNSTLEILRTFKKARVVGVDIAPEMLDYARVKFGFTDGCEMMRNLVLENDMQLALFINKFRGEAAEYQMRLKFKQGDFMKFMGEPADAAVGAHFFHWLPLQDAAAARLNFLMKTDGFAALSSSAAFYSSKKWNMEEVYYLHHPIIRHYLDVLGRKIREYCGKEWDGKVPAGRKDPQQTVALFESRGFEALACKEIPLPKVKSSVIFGYVARMVPDHIGMFDDAILTDDEKDMLVGEAISETIKNKGSEIPDRLPSDLLFLFLFRKTQDDWEGWRKSALFFYECK
ncbi:MAG: class I SAM-dependent methyltransferase [Candidatus Micrarchaeota archaeon]|nr:class I SAM-dependent methyltransferase [Candidatus Micrarchaeota archaeon]